MKKPLFVVLLCTFLPLAMFAQFGKNYKYSTVHIAATLNYYAPIEPYTVFNDFETEDQRLILDFQTRNTGTFVIEDLEPLYVESTTTFNFPSQLLGFGMSIQFLTDKFLYQELSVTQLTLVKFETTTEFQINNIDGDLQTILIRGQDQKTSVFGLRYEVGKYFGNQKSLVKFGLGGGFESTFYKYELIPKSSDTFPVRANITTIELSVIPLLSVKISKKVTLDFKVISNFLIADFDTVIIDDPGKPKIANSLTRSYNLPEVDFGGSLVLRCQIKDAKKRKRRRG